MEKIKSKFTERSCEKYKIDAIAVDDITLEKVFSLNKDRQNKEIIENADVIIVGTLTPANGMSAGYYYTSPRNKVFKTLDECYGCNGEFEDIKNRLNKNPQNHEIILELENFIRKLKIAFIDVIDEAIRIKGSSNDSDILYYTLDYKAFKNCTPNQIFICTSKNSQNCLEKICEREDIKITPKQIHLCPQDRFHYKKEQWKETLQK